MIRTPRQRAARMSAWWPAISCAAVTGVPAASPPPMSLMPSNTMTVRTPGWPSASRRNRSTAAAPKPGRPLSTLLPPMPALTTPVGRPAATSRSASSSGYRLSASTVDIAPSVRESPNATTVPPPPLVGPLTSRPDSRYEEVDVSP
jgi:hypothetical protein